MVRLATNLKYLRTKNKMSQSDLASRLDIARTTLGDYERGKTEPSLDMLVKLAEIFKVDIDSFIALDLSTDNIDISLSEDLRILAISVDQENNGNIELVDTKAEAGYLDSFQNPEFIKDLPKISFPNMPHGTYRGFEISGDSMLPVEPGSLVICSYVERLNEIKDGHTYIIVTKDQGLVYKRVVSDIDNQRLTLISDNKAFLPYQIEMSEVAEIWKYYAHLSFSDGMQSFEYLLDERITDIQNKVNDLHQRLS